MRRKSAAEKHVAGTYRASRDRRSPQFTSADGVKPPSYLRKNRVALAEWKAVAPYLEAEGVLKRTDISLLASYCILYSRWREAASKVDELGQVIEVVSTTRTGKTVKPVLNAWVRSEVLFQSQMMKAAVKFGLNPLDRPRVEASPFEGPDELEQFINAGLSDTHNFSADQ